MAQIVELDALVPEDIVFRYKGEDLVLPGDITVKETFRVQRLMVSLADAETDVIKASAQGKSRNTKALATQERVTLEVEEFLLDLFRRRNPELVELPFGAVGFQYVLATVLKKLGFGEALVDALREDGDPPKGKPSPPSKSRRSTSSSS